MVTSRPRSSQLNVEIKKSITALRQKHMNVEEEAWGTFRYPVFKIDQGRDTVASRQTTTSNWARPHEKHVRDTEIVTWARGDRRILTVSQQACWGRIS